MKTSVFFALFVWALLFCLPAQAQQRSTKTITEGGKTYYLHNVKRGESLQSIAKVYNVRPEDIVKANSKLKRQIRRNKIIKVPVNEGKYIFHTVEKNQTVYFISQKYDVGMKKILELNPKAKKGLEVGQILRIPNPDAAAQEPDITPTPPDSSGFADENLPDENAKIDGDLESVVEYTDNPCLSYEYAGEAFKVGVMLPLHIEANQNIRFRSRENKTDIKFFKNSERFFEFYEGVLMALDTLRKEGINAEIFIYDTEQDPEKVEELLEKNKEMTQLDLIIGPVYPENVKVVSQFATENNINFVSPLARHDSLTQSSPHLFQVNSSMETRVVELADFLNKVQSKNIIFIHNGTEAEKKYIDICRRELKAPILRDSVMMHEIYLTSRSHMYGVRKLLSRDLSNVVLIFSENEVFVSSVVGKLSSLGVNKPGSYMKWDITVFGAHAWEHYENMDIEYSEPLNIHYYSTSFADRHDPRVRYFRRIYEAVFNAVPSQYSYQGYDVTYFFIKAMKKYGKHFQNCINQDDLKISGLQCEFEFKRVAEKGGYENSGISILKFDEDYYLQKRNKNQSLIFLYEDQ